IPSADLLSSVKRCATLPQELEDVLGHGAHLAALVGNLDICARPQVLLVDLGDSVGNRDRITYGEHAVGDALLVWRPSHDLFVDVVRAEVARDAGEQVNVGLADGLGKRNRVADLQGYGSVHRLFCVSASLHALLLPISGLRSPLARSPARRVPPPCALRVRGAACARVAPPRRSGQGGRAPVPCPPSGARRSLSPGCGPPAGPPRRPRSR